MTLTATAVLNAKAGINSKGNKTNKPYKLSDGEGLYLEVTPKGQKYWRLKYRFDGKEKRLSIGVYPAIPLKEARKKRDEAKALLLNGVDPGEFKKTIKKQENLEGFEYVAREWHTKHKANWTDSHAKKLIDRLEKDVFPWLGTRPSNEITPPELLAILRRVESRGALDTAHRIMQTCGQVFRYAVATGRAERDPSVDLKGAIPPAKKSHLASIVDPVKIGQLLRAIDGYEGHFVTRSAMRLASYVFVRPGELRQAEWSEIDLDIAEWRIPAEKMKMRELHIVPLSSQALEILKEIKPLTGHARYVFPSIRTNKRPMSENTVNAGLRRLGYSKDEMTGHGFRSMASTLLNEQGWHRDAIERQLAHAERDSVRAAYNYAEHLPERKKMMQFWSNYLDGLKKGADVVPIRKQA